MHAGDQAHEGSCQTQEPGLVFYLFSFTLGGCLCICHVFFNSFMFTLFLFVPVLQDHFMSQATKFSDFCFCALEWFQHQLQHPVLLATCAQTMPAIGKYFFFGMCDSASLCFKAMQTVKTMKATQARKSITMFVCN